MKKILNLILTPWNTWNTNRLLKKRLEELRKRDPFIYK